MADMVAIRRLVTEANGRDAGDDETRMARFQQKLEEFLTPEVFKAFGFNLEWSEGGARKREPSAVADLGKTHVAFYEGIEGHQFIVSFMHKNTFGPRGRRLRHVDSKDEFLKMLQGWI